MSFFEPPPPPPEPPQAAMSVPEWLGPPENVVPASFPLELMLARTDELALFVHSGRAYAHGFEFTFGLRTRKARERRGDDPMMGWHAARHGTLDDEMLRFGVAFADGRKATIFDGHPWWGAPESPPEPDIVLMQRGGGGGGTAWNFNFWSWPLPPEGLLEFVVEWPSEGIELTRAGVDSATVRDAANRAVTLWPDREPGHGSARAWTRLTK
jgi:hypothetical protein